MVSLLRVTWMFIAYHSVAKRNIISKIYKKANKVQGTQKAPSSNKVYVLIVLTAVECYKKQKWLRTLGFTKNHKHVSVCHQKIQVTFPAAHKMAHKCEAAVN